MSMQVLPILYADDILLYRAVQCQINYTALQCDVDMLAALASCKLLTFNPKKCKAMLLSCKRRQGLLLNGLCIETRIASSILESI